MNRRKFLILAGLMAGSSLPVLSGTWLHSNRGENLPSLDPFAPDPWQETSAAGPVLLLVNEDPLHPFGRFLAEILWAEGLNAFTAARLSDASTGLLEQYPCVLLSAGKVTSAAVDLLAAYAAGGGRLIVFQPDENLAEGLGLQPSRGTLQEGLAWTEAQHPLASGIVDRPLSLHVGAGLYPLEDGEAVAWLGDPAASEAALPALYLKRAGSGLVAVWAYDLAENVALTRQGNPALAAGADGRPLQVPVDMFKGWIDFNRLSYPQADEQQRLLANLITWMCRERMPLPRLWYFPGQSRSLLVMTSDLHRNTIAALLRITGLVEQYQASISLNYTPPLVSDPGLLKVQFENAGARMGLLPQPYFPNPEQFDRLRSRGHEVTVHPYITDTYMDSWRRYWIAFTRMQYGPITQTSRVHDLDWRGWSDAARMQAGMGLRLNTDYYHIGQFLYKGPSEWAYGHFNGSGLPMRFANYDGRILKIYQQVTQFNDDHFLELPWTSKEHMGPERGVQLISEFFQASLDGSFAAVGVNCHADPYDMEDRWRLPAAALMTGTLAAAKAKGVPIWTAQRWLDFTTARQSARFEGLRWQEHKLAFDLEAWEKPVDGLSVLIPLENGTSALHLVRVDGQTVRFTNWQVGGVSYGLVSLAAGSHHLEAVYL